MSELQRLWARSKVGVPNDALIETDEELENDVVPELPEHPDDDSSSASSVSSTGTIIPSPNQNLFARPQKYAHPGL
jgi:protein phosphatase methylesterase 1